MNPMRYVLLVLLFLTQFAPAFAEKISLRDLSAYLNGITTAEFEFSQINDDGSVVSGEHASDIPSPLSPYRTKFVISFSDSISRFHNLSI